MTALEGMRILDMTQWEAGTSCTQALAWLGADVVKVEQPIVGDPGRGRIGGSTLDREYFVMWNSNKRSVTLDLNQENGRQLLLDMLPNYDVFIENYGPGVVEKLNIGYEVMKEINPSIIYVRIKGFGTTGPYSGYKCMDMVAQAAAGAFSITGNPDGPPMRPGPTMADAGTGTQAALVVSAAYTQKLRTGEGQLIELSMQEAMTYYLRTAVSSTQYGKVPTPRTGNGSDPFMALYPCAPGGANDYVFIMAVNPRMWTAVCNVIGKPDLFDDERFKTRKDRYENREAMFEEIASWTRQHSKKDAMQMLAEAGICASQVYETNDLFTDPHLLERDFVHEVEHADHGDIKLLGWPAKMSKSQVAIQASPLLGEHTDEVMAEDLGLEQKDIDALRQEGAIGSEMIERGA
ncbi:MAG TPA: CoA transferase [Pseudomonadales bacterium]|mgnify:CR=1 FL=1|jgi:formyl-CoA transferase|nr:CoA transferase [Pseudomonadales bacterium]MDP7316511.1 CoA transferase [Pseudomonadales bacterium]MDP7577492.1 CoA transferase [Pseudomonadales bacterium]HJL61291.1 CoA transferase [Pseudomonadales bacterium]HJP51870.1 CoA transferase [Pseudomonadales bacterium]|tara:strand:+ start:58 stop:1272 length:1215 start_codon:yes stop_codon:yes gene_type:complete